MKITKNHDFDISHQMGVVVNLTRVQTSISWYANKCINLKRHNFQPKTVIFKSWRNFWTFRKLVGYFSKRNILISDHDKLNSLFIYDMETLNAWLLWNFCQKLWNFCQKLWNFYPKFLKIEILNRMINCDFAQFRPFSRKLQMYDYPKS